MSDSHFDAIVVGSGFGGSVTAYRLAEAGRSVCILERGRAYPPGSFTRSPYKARDSFWNPARGLTGALRSLDVETADLERYPLEVEEAVYFSCRALRRRAARARVWSEGATLRLELVGLTSATGGELSHARERIAAVGGQLDLSADCVSAAVPVR